MVSILKSILNVDKGPLRAFDAGRDLASSADLIELCFAGTLDPDGQRYLNRMRQAAKDPGFLRWSGVSAGWAGVPTDGFVWEEDGRLVGNLSLIPYTQKGARGYLIANVAVHPNYRRRGIGRALTLRAIDQVRSLGLPNVWLQVREENDPAIRLYLSLGFVERARRTTWILQHESVETLISPVLSIGPRRSRDWPQQQAWLRHNYPPDLNWHLPFQLNAFRPGLLGGIYRGLNDLYIQQWSVYRANQLLATVAWQSSGSYANALWLAAPMDGDVLAITALLRHARCQSPSQRPVSLDYPAHQLVEAIGNAGFTIRQTLIWMEKSFSPH